MKDETKSKLCIICGVEAAGCLLLGIPFMLSAAITAGAIYGPPVYKKIKAKLNEPV